MYAAVEREDSGKVVKALLDSGADVNPPNEVLAKNPLCYAIMRRRPGFVEILIDAGADVNSRDDYFDTPLHKVAIVGNVSCFKSLIERGADPNAVNARF